MVDQNNMKLTLSGIKELVDELVEEKLVHILKDPDEGLEFREEIKTRLRKSLKSQGDGERGIPLENVINDRQNSK